MIAARHTKLEVLAAFMNFYASNIHLEELRTKNCPKRYIFKGENRDCKKTKENEECKICCVKNLLHVVDRRRRNLTYYIVTAEEKCLSAYGLILQLEQDFHILNRNKSVPLDILSSKQKTEAIKSHSEKGDMDYLKLQEC